MGGNPDRILIGLFTRMTKIYMQIPIHTTFRGRSGVMWKIVIWFSWVKFHNSQNSDDMENYTYIERHNILIWKLYIYFYSFSSNFCSPLFVVLLHGLLFAWKIFHSSCLLLLKSAIFMNNEIYVLRCFGDMKIMAWGLCFY